jgi:hypothetical protein
MTRPTRRDFFAFSAAGIASLARSSDCSTEIRAGIVGWDERSKAAARVFHEIPGLTVSSLSAPGSEHADAIEFFSGMGGETPALHASVRSMVSRRKPDLLYAMGDAPDVGLWRGHLLLDGPADPPAYCGAAAAGRCIQFLPRFQFVDYGRPASLLRRDWRSARIDCHAPLPTAAIEDSRDLARWLNREVGDAVDFTCELLGLSEPLRILGAATPAATPSSARFGWRVAEQRTGGKTMEVSVLASHATNAWTRIEIHLWSERGAIVLRASPRSAILTRLLTFDLLMAMEKRSPGRLLFGPDVLTKSQRLISRFSEAI